MSRSNRKKHGKFAEWELVNSHTDRRSFVTNQFGKMLSPIIKAASGHKSELLYLKYVTEGRAEVVNIPAEYWYGRDVENKSKQT